MCIFDQAIISSIVEVPKICVTHDAAAMSTMVMDHTQIPFLCQILHKIIIPFLVFTHSMQNLHHTDDLCFRRNCHRMNL